MWSRPTCAAMLAASAPAGTCVSPTAPMTSRRSWTSSAPGKVIAAGYSMGGPVAQLLWRRHPDKVAGLVLCATAPAFSAESRHVTDASLASLAGLTRVAGQLAAVPAAGANLLRRVRADRPAGFLEWAAEEMRRHDVRMLTEAARSITRFDLPQLDRRHRRPDRGAPHQPRPPRRPGAADGVRHEHPGCPPRRARRRPHRVRTDDLHRADAQRLPRRRVAGQRLIRHQPGARPDPWLLVDTTVEASRESSRAEGPTGWAVLTLVRHGPDPYGRTHEVIASLGRADPRAGTGIGRVWRVVEERGNGTGAAGSDDLASECGLAAFARATKPVDITFWNQNQTQVNSDWLKKTTAAFNASQDDVHVSLLQFPNYQDLLTKYLGGLSSGDLPDLFQPEDTTVQRLIDSRSTVPMQACVDADHYSLKDFLPRATAFYSYKRRVAGHAVDHLEHRALVQPHRLPEGRPRSEPSAGDARRSDVGLAQDRSERRREARDRVACRAVRLRVPQREVGRHVREQRQRP